MSALVESLTRPRRTRGMLLLWLAAGFAFTAVIAVFVLKGDGSDFAPVWNAADALLAGTSPYVDNPRFVYPPSTLSLVSPLGLLGQEAAHTVFLVGDAAAIVAAGLLCLRIFGVSLRSPAAPLLVLALSGFAPVDTTLHLGNVNGFIAAGGAGVLLAASRGHWSLGGWLLGLTLALKPILAPILLLPLLYRQWGALARALVVPAGLLGATLLLAPRSADFFEGRAGFYTDPHAGPSLDSNVALGGVLNALGSPAVLTFASRALVVAACAYLVWMLFANRAADRVGRLVDMYAVAMLGAFLVHTLSLNYYALYLLPVLVAVLLGRSAMRWWGAAGGVVLFGSPDVFVWRALWREDGALAQDLATLRVTAGLLVVLAAYLVALRPGRRERALLAAAVVPLRRRAAAIRLVREAPEAEAGTARAQVTETATAREPATGTARAQVTETATAREPATESGRV
jgi:arabinofuranan 3-O-arabinosyltransferase